MPYNPRDHGALCDQCPCHELKPVPPEGNIASALIGIVGEGPGFQEVKFGQPFIGPSGRMLKQICMNVGVRREDLWITNAILCRAEVPSMQGKKRYDIPTFLAWVRMENRRRRKIELPPIASPFDCCMPRLYAELGFLEHYAAKRKQPNGAVVMPLGNVALYSIALKKKISRWRGSPIPVDTFDAWKETP